MLLRLSERTLRSIVQSCLEQRVREADVSSGARVEFGSDEHVADLERRLSDALFWRDRQRRGSESRANYQRLSSRLRAELHSAKRIASRRTMQTEAVRAVREETEEQRRDWENAIRYDKYRKECARCGQGRGSHKTFCPDGGAPDFWCFVPGRPDLPRRKHL